MQVQIFPSGCALKPSYANPTATSLAVIHPTNVSLDAVATSGETTTAMYSSNLGVERSSECHNRRAIVRSCALCLHQRGALCRAARYRLRPSRAFVYRWSHPRSLKQVLYVCDSKCRLSLAASGECRASRQLAVGAVAGSYMLVMKGSTFGPSLHNSYAATIGTSFVCLSVPT